MPPTSAAARRVLRAYFAELASRYYEKQLPFGTGKGRPPVI